MNALMTLATIWLVSAVVMALVWWLSMRLNNVGYVDVAWAGLMSVAALLAGLNGAGGALVRSLVAMFGMLWGARLCLHLLRRALNEEEDGRYRALRAAWRGSRLKFLLFFQMQAVMVALFSLPFIAASCNHQHLLSGWMIAGIGVWLVSVAGESLADQQLASFRADPDNRGKSCRRGLWSWSRHPNYFFEWLHWFAYVLLAVGSPIFLWSLLGPLLMLAFLYQLSGIPWTEAQALRTRGDDYARYQREVSAFVPWPPRQ